MQTHWKKLKNPDYIGAYAFAPGEEKIGTISKATEETVTNPEGKKTDCLVVHFTQPDLKPLIVNSTNARAIEKLLGSPYIEDWIGSSIVLVVRKIKAFGEQVDAVRVKMEKVSGVCSLCGKRITAAGEMTAQQVVEYTREKMGRPLCSECAKKQRSKS